ncbi:MAG TPA: methylaspartate ammonia-lyase, partial [Candidatus Saccharicenans sp.]|nr:methylaspartate ammonia-lyase [Candidatus Saccharicenans sp.]
MKIKNVLFVPGKSAFFFDDQKAIKNGAKLDGFVYEGQPVTKGFTTIRQAGECVSILLELEDGRLAVGDCAAVQYSGVG